MTIFAMPHGKHSCSCVGGIHPLDCLECAFWHRQGRPGAITYAHLATHGIKMRDHGSWCDYCGDKDYGNGELVHRPSCPVDKENQGRELDNGPDY